VPDLPSQIVVAPVPHCANTPAHRGSLLRLAFAGLSVAGVTGTNGKTTCAYLLAQALEPPAGPRPTWAPSAPAARTRSWSSR
jgi:UDP-N-acetylmuramyl tripeptide synthase